MGTRRGLGSQVHRVARDDESERAEGAERLVDDLRNGRVDLVTFTSSSTARNFRSLLPDDEIDQLLARVRVASIGPVTTETAASLGIPVDTTAAEYTIPGLCQAIQKLYTPSGS